MKTNQLGYRMPKMPICSQTVSQDVFILSLMCCKQAIRASISCKVPLILFLYTPVHYVYGVHAARCIGAHLMCIINPLVWNRLWASQWGENQKENRKRRRKERRKKTRLNGPAIFMLTYSLPLLCVCLCVFFFISHSNGDCTQIFGHKLNPWRHDALFSLLALWNSVQMKIQWKRHIRSITWRFKRYVIKLIYRVGLGDFSIC